MIVCDGTVITMTQCAVCLRPAAMKTVPETDTGMIGTAWMIMPIIWTTMMIKVETPAFGTGTAAVVHSLRTAMLSNSDRSQGSSLPVSELGSTAFCPLPLTLPLYQLYRLKKEIIPAFSVGSIFFRRWFQRKKQFQHQKQRAWFPPPNPGSFFIAQYHLFQEVTP